LREGLGVGQSTFTTMGTTMGKIDDQPL